MRVNRPSSYSYERLTRWLASRHTLKKLAPTLDGRMGHCKHKHQPLKVIISCSDAVRAHTQIHFFAKIDTEREASAVAALIMAAVQPFSLVQARIGRASVLLEFFVLSSVTSLPTQPWPATRSAPTTDEKGKKDKQATKERKGEKRPNKGKNKV